MRELIWLLVIQLNFGEVAHLQGQMRPLYMITGFKPFS